MESEMVRHPWECAASRVISERISMWIYRRRGGERRGAEVGEGVGDGGVGNGWIRQRRGKTRMVGVWLCHLRCQDALRTCAEAANGRLDWGFEQWFEGVHLEGAGRLRKVSGISGTMRRG